MDYLNLPRSLIYKDRTDLKDFGVQVINTVNHNLFSNLKMLFKATDRAKELILRSFNNAYYICTLIPFEDFPDTQVAEYEKLLLKDDLYDCEEICAVSMAMVCKLLPACDARWRSENNDLINSINYRFTHYQWMNSGARKSFEFMEEKHNTNNLFLPPNEFAPRDIIEVIETFSVSDLQDYAEYISERLVHLEDPRQRMLGFNTARLRIEKYQRELCENTEYNPKKDCFEYGDNYIRDLTLEERVRNCYQKSKKAIEYYTKHYPDEDIPTFQTDVSNMSLTSEEKRPQIDNIQQSAETGKVKAELEAKEKLLEEYKKTITEQEKIIEDYKSKFDPDDIKKKKVVAMTGRQHAILLLAILAYENRLPNARTNLSRLLCFIAGRNESTMEAYLKRAITPAECDELADWFCKDGDHPDSNECPFLADIIRQLPDKLKKDKAEKNRNKALKNKNE